MSYDVTAVGESALPVQPAGLKATEAQKAIEGKSPWVLAVRRLRRDRAAMICLGIIVFIAACAIGAPIFAMITSHGNMQQFTSTGLAANCPERHVLAGDR
jgi:hypothetical protein